MPGAARENDVPLAAKQVVRRRSPGRPKLQDVAEIDNTLLRAALDEFVSSGYSGASMRSIAKAAGLSRTTLLARYSSKEDLFAAIMSQQIDRMAAAASLRSPEGRADLYEGLEAYGNRALEFSLHGDLLEVNRLICSQSHRFPELGEAAGRSTRLGIEQITDFIRQAVSAGDTRCADPEAVAEAYILMLRGWYLNIMIVNRSVSPEERRTWVNRAVGSLKLSPEPSNEDSARS